jgi:hypothetical protein
MSRPPFSPVNDRLGFELTGLYRVPLIVGIQGLPEGWVVKSVRYDGRDITGAPTDFGVESTPRAIEIVVTNRVARPSVRVTDERGLPVTGYHVVLVPWDPTRWRDAILGSPPATSPDGVQQLGPRLPGEYLLAALSTADYLLLIRDPTRFDDLAPVASRVRLAEGDSRTYELRLTELPPARR